ncbi:DUF4864 domain-containing protein [Roseobacter sp. HKCCA0434]|uniref:DUF4864 domain-containing protein n=1 Tax=Roseobacter sp. HKCCA0434 TaxID=3079297 RepID=UPI002905D739|nr:DUF4864 domain-containing protein [Roseobacter sp. HKCCA0434]
MKWFLAGLMALCLAAGAARADEAAVRDVIAQQIDAFGREDLDGAFTHASPMIQRMFGGPERFGAMVRQGYPMVWRPTSLRFGLTRSEGETVYQQVILGDARGNSHVAEYELIELEGVWRINGVQLLPDAGAGA